MTKAEADQLVARIFSEKDPRIDDDLDELERLGARRDLMRWLLEPLTPDQVDDFCLELSPRVRVE